MCTGKYPTDFLYLIPRTDLVNQSLKLLTICFFNKVYILFLFVILKCHMVADTNPQYVTIVLSDHSWKQHNYPNGDLTFHWVLMDCFLSTFLIQKKKKAWKVIVKVGCIYLVWEWKNLQAWIRLYTNCLLSTQSDDVLVLTGGSGSISDGKQN